MQIRLLFFLTQLVYLIDLEGPANACQVSWLAEKLRGRNLVTSQENCKTSTDLPITAKTVSCEAFCDLGKILKTPRRMSKAFLKCEEGEWKFLEYASDDDTYGQYKTLPEEINDEDLFVCEEDKSVKLCPLAQADEFGLDTQNYRSIAQDTGTYTFYCKNIDFYNEEFSIYCSQETLYIDLYWQRDIKIDEDYIKGYCLAKCEVEELLTKTADKKIEVDSQIKLKSTAFQNEEVKISCPNDKIFKNDIGDTNKPFISEKTLKCNAEGKWMLKDETNLEDITEHLDCIEKPCFITELSNLGMVPKKDYEGVYITNNSKITIICKEGMDFMGNEADFIENAEREMSCNNGVWIFENKEANYNCTEREVGEKDCVLKQGEIIMESIDFGNLITLYQGKKARVNCKNNKKIGIEIVCVNSTILESETQIALKENSHEVCKDYKKVDCDINLLYTEILHEHQMALMSLDCFFEVKGIKSQKPNLCRVKCLSPLIWKDLRHRPGNYILCDQGNWKLFSPTDEEIKLPENSKESLCIVEEPPCDATEITGDVFFEATAEDYSELCRNGVGVNTFGECTL